MDDRGHCRESEAKNAVEDDLDLSDSSLAPSASMRSIQANAQVISSRLADPVLYLKPQRALNLAAVVADRDQRVRRGMGGDP